MAKERLDTYIKSKYTACNFLLCSQFNQSPTSRAEFIILSGCSEVPLLGFPNADPRDYSSDIIIVSICLLTLTPYSFPNAHNEVKTKSFLNSNTKPGETLNHKF